MKILITGARGFVGSYLVKHLPSNYNIVAATRADLDLLNRDAVKSFLEQGQFDVVVHAAVEGRDLSRSVNPALMYNNLQMFFNLADHSDLYGRFINFGCGTEFDIDVSCTNVSESLIFKQYPKTSYGASKNIISRTCVSLPNFITLRMFGCLDASESTHRKLPVLQHFIRSLKYYDPDGWALENDRFFDWFSLHDISVVVDAVIQGKIPYKDMNLVYDQKYRISEFLQLYCTVHNLDADCLRINSTSETHHTGDGSKLASCNLPLWGLERSLKEYGF
jgi:nucleoside-diphosphate-sugar epimerase